MFRSGALLLGRAAESPITWNVGGRSAKYRRHPQSWRYPQSLAHKVKSNTNLPPQRILLGVSLILAAAFTISVQDVVFKVFSSEMTLWQIFALRGCLAVPVLFAIAMSRGVLRVATGKWLLLRSLFITSTFLAFYAAIPFLSLSTVGAANYIAPIFVTLLSAYVIKEPVRWLGWVGVLIGFAGVLVLLQPGTDAFSAWALLPVLGAAFYALAHIITRAKCQEVPLAAIALSQNVVMLLAGMLVSLVLIGVQPQRALIDAHPYIFGAWSTVEAQDWLILAVLAGFSIGIAILLAGAYQAAPPAVISTFEYSYLIFVAAWDVLFFGLTLSLATVTGMIMIVAAGLLVLRSKSQR
ncbi:MAG: DMT family transporter [Pseudomonadota bacterium]